MFYFISLYMQQVLGYSAIHAGLSYLPLAVTIIVAAGLGGQLVTRFGFKPILAAGMLFVAAGLLWFSQVSVGGGFLTDILGASLLAAIGLGFGFVTSTIAAVSGVEEREQGLASGLINTSQQIGGALGLAVFDDRRDPLDLAWPTRRLPAGSSGLCGSAAPSASQACPPRSCSSGAAILATAPPESQRHERNTMSFQLHANSTSGASLVRTAERLAESFAARADEHDRNGSYPFEAIDALRDERYFAAPVPRELGGLGVASVHDLVIASSRLARGNASIAIGVNMHLTVLLNIVRRYSMAVAAGSDRRIAAFGRSLEAFARQDVVLASAVSERNQDLTRPATRATSTREGWLIDGTKVFCTMSPAATHLMAAVTSSQTTAPSGTVRSDPGRESGVAIGEDWDALGMRASGSHSVTFDGVVPPGTTLSEAGSWRGDPIPYMSGTSRRGFTPRRRSVSPRWPTRQRHARPRRAESTTRGPGSLAAEASIDLSACRAALARTAEPDRRPPPEQPDARRHGRRDPRPVHRGAGDEDVRQRSRDAGRRPCARNVRGQLAT